jgi:hypothetical protein
MGLVFGTNWFFFLIFCFQSMDRLMDAATPTRDIETNANDHANDENSRTMNDDDDAMTDAGSEEGEVISPEYQLELSSRVNIDEWKVWRITKQISLIPLIFPNPSLHHCANKQTNNLECFFSGVLSGVAS